VSCRQHPELQSSDVWFHQQSLKIPEHIVRSFFNFTVTRIAEYIAAQCAKYRDRMAAVYVVGGFSLSKMVMQAIATAMKPFPEIKRIVPAHPSEAVLTGAVLYGLRPEQIKSRISPYTYLLRVYKPWSAEYDALPAAEMGRFGPCKCPSVNGKKQCGGSCTKKKFCTNAVLKFCTVGETISANHAGFEQRGLTPPSSCGSLEIKFGRTKQPNPKLWTEGEGVESIGTYES
jgi:hypothetical protein